MERGYGSKGRPPRRCGVGMWKFSAGFRCTVTQYLLSSFAIHVRCLAPSPIPSTHLGLTTHRQTWLFSSTWTYHSTDLLTVHGVAHRTSGSTSYETIPHIRLETFRVVLSTKDMVVKRRDGPRRLRDDVWQRWTVIAAIDAFWFGFNTCQDLGAKLQGQQKVPLQGVA